MAKLVHPDGATVIDHDGKAYRPDRRGVFTVPDHIVPALRPHGFRSQDELDAAKDEAEAANQITLLETELTDLRAAAVAAELHITDLEAKLAAATTQVTELEGKLTATDAQIAELQGQLAAATTAKKGKAAEAPADAATQQGQA